MNVIRLLVWLLPLAGAGLAFLILIIGFASATGAPQEAVVAALACALAILPYVFARAVSEIFASVESSKVERNHLPSIQPSLYEPTSAQTSQTTVAPFSALSDGPSDRNEAWKFATIAAAILGIVLFFVFVLNR